MKRKNRNAPLSSSSPARGAAAQGGFSLIEVLVAMVIFLVVVAAVYQVMRISLIQRNTVSTRIDAAKSARIALNYIRRDAINAGLSYHNVGGLAPDGFVNKTVGVATDTDTDTRDMLTGIICGNDVTGNSLNAPTAKTDVVGFVTRDLSFNGGNFISVTGTSVSGNDVIVSTGAGQAAAATKKYDLYLIETATSQVIGLVTDDPATSTFKLGFGTGVDPLGVNLSANGTGSQKSMLVGTGITGTLKKINLVTYGVKSDGTLIRKTYANNTGKTKDEQIETRELIYNVKDFQVTYLLDDGTRTSDPTGGNNGRLNQQKMNKVIQMEVSITVMQAGKDSQVLEPVTIKEVISARNLRYTIS